MSGLAESEAPPSSPPLATGTVDQAAVTQAKAERQEMRGLALDQGKRRRGRPPGSKNGDKKPAEEVHEVDNVAHKRNVGMAKSFLKQGNKGWRSSEKNFEPFMEPGELQWDDEELEFGAECTVGTCEALDPSSKVAKYLPVFGLVIFTATTLISRFISIKRAIILAQMAQEQAQTGKTPTVDGKATVK